MKLENTTDTKRLILAIKTQINKDFKDWELKNLFNMLVETYINEYFTTAEIMTSSKGLRNATSSSEVYFEEIKTAIHSKVDGNNEEFNLGLHAEIMDTDFDKDLSIWIKGIKEDGQLVFYAEYNAERF